MSKALQALSLLVEKSIYGNKENNRASIFEAEKIIKQAITPPSSEGLCKDLSEVYKADVFFEPYFQDFKYIHKYKDTIVTVVHKDGDGLIYIKDHGIKPELMMRIGNFYKNLETINECGARRYV